MPTLALSHPAYLLLFLPLVGWCVWVQRGSLAGLRAGRARGVLAARLALLGLLVAALAGPTVRFPARTLSVLFLLDRSASVPPSLQKQEVELVNRAARRLPPESRAGVVVFGSDAMLESEPVASPVLRGIHSVISPDGTDVAGAIRLGLTLLPTDSQRRLVLVSDGAETLGDARAEAEAAAASGVEVDVVPAEYHNPREALLEGFSAPERARKGEPLDVTVRARATFATRATLRLLRDGELVAERPWSLHPGTQSLTVPETLVKPGFHTWEASLDAPGDAIADNNRALGFTYVAGKPRVLLIEGTRGEGDALAAVLRGRSLDVAVRGAGGLPATLAEFGSWDSILLDNVRADAVSPGGMRLLRSAVRDLGVGCVMIGGENSLTAGGWHGTPVEELLPVQMETPRRREQAELSLALVIDRSASMGQALSGGEKLAFAKQAALATSDAMRPEDELGVVAFDDAPEWMVPLAPRGDGSRARAGIEQIAAGGGTQLYPALEEARRALQHSRAALKHLLVLTDGQSLPADFEGLARGLGHDRITMSTVGVGPDADSSLLSRLASLAGGRYYEARDVAALPLIFDRETRLAGRAALVEEPFTPRVAEGTPLLRELPKPPPLLGYVATTVKDAPGVEVALSSRRGDPVVASWRYGLGRALAVTTDARARWAAPWAADPGAYFARFWTQLVRQSLRATQPKGLEASVEIRQGVGRVAVDALSAAGEFRNGVELFGRVSGPDGAEPLRFSQSGPGRYEATFPASRTGQYLASISDGRAGGLTAVGAAVPYSPELRSLDANSPLLLAVAERSGGMAYPSLGPGLHDALLTRMFRPGKPAGTTPREVWPQLLLSAALLLPLDVGLRRLVGDRRELAAAFAPLGLWLGGGRKQAGPADAGMSRLLAARRRAGMHGDSDAVADAPVAVAPERGEPPVASPHPAAPATPSSDAELNTRRLLDAKRRVRDPEREGDTDT